MGDGFPDLRLIDMLTPGLAQRAIIKLPQRRGQPGGRMYAIGDGGNRRFVHVNARPQELPHAPRHVAVQLADAVVLVGKPQRQHGHAEAWPPVLVLPGQVDKLVAVEAQLPPEVVEEPINRSSPKASLPAGTGVCVVKTALAATASRASAKVRLASAISSRIRSSPRKAACPSFMCQSAGFSPSARSARTPPMPSTISCEMRISWSPP